MYPNRIYSTLPTGIYEFVRVRITTNSLIHLFYFIYDYFSVFYDLN